MVFTAAEKKETNTEIYLLYNKFGESSKKPDGK